MPTRNTSTEEWRAIARGPRPLYYILTWPDKEDWTEEEFYETGRVEWEDFRDHWTHYGRGPLGSDCLEIGCGAGRFTRQLAQEFDHVVAIDVSADLIARADAATQDNVDFHQVDGTHVPLPDGSVDAAFSVHVLQHLGGFEEVESYLREVRRTLRPGGTAMLHIMLASSEGPLIARDGGRLRREISLWRSRRALRRGEENWTVRTRMYRFEDVYAALAKVGFEDIQLRAIPVRTNGYPHTFWLMRAPGQP
jgi:ubiquinone/menaquinone biosynthesis C-methylase UbiE